MGALVLALLAAERDCIQLEGGDAHFEPADIEYNRDLQLLEALAGKDLVQPEFSKHSSGAGVVKAGGAGCSSLKSRLCWLWRDPEMFACTILTANWCCCWVWGMVHWHCPLLILPHSATSVNMAVCIRRRYHAWRYLHRSHMEVTIPQQPT